MRNVWGALVKLSLFWVVFERRLSSENILHSSIKKQQTELILTLTFLAVISQEIRELKLFLFFLLIDRRFGTGGRAVDTTFPPAQSSKHEKMSERPPEAALGWFTLICADEAFWL